MTILLYCHSFNNADLFLKAPRSMPALLYELLTSFNSNLLDALQQKIVHAMSHILRSSDQASPP